MGYKTTAKAANITQRAVAKQRKRGVPESQIVAGAKARAGRKAIQSQPISDEEYIQAVRRKAMQDALKAELDNKEREGKLVEESVVVREWSGILSAVRDACLGLPLKVSGRLAAMTDQREIERYLKTTLRAELGKISNQLADPTEAAA